MAKLTTKNIYLGDSFNVHYACWRRRTLQQPRSQFGGTEATFARDPLTPMSATVKLVNFETNQVIPLGYEFADEATATVDGNEVRYAITPEFLTAEGIYRVYTKFMVDAETVRTEVLQFRVMATS